MRNRLLIVASIGSLLTFGASASAQDQPVPDAPQPQKKAAPKPQPPPDAPSSEPAQQPAAKDDNPFPEAVSRDAAKTANTDKNGDPTTTPDAPGTAKHGTADDNPFPESVSRDAAKAAGSDPDQTATPAVKSNVPPGISSSSRSEGTVESEPQVTDPARAKKDAEVGGFYLTRGDYQGALLRFKDATATDPTNVDAIFGLAETQQRLKNNVEAARNYQLYLDIVPNGPKAKEAIKALKALGPGK